MAVIDSCDGDDGSVSYFKRTWKYDDEGKYYIAAASNSDYRLAACEMSSVYAGDADKS